VPTTPIEVREAFIQVLESLEKIFKDNANCYNVAHYQLCSQVISPLLGESVLPINAIAAIDKLIATLST